VKLIAQLITALLLVTPLPGLAGSRAFVPNTGYGQLIVVDLATDAILKTIDLGYTPSGVAVSAAANRVAVTLTDLGAVQLRDATTYALLSTVSTGPAPIGAAFSKDGRRLYVANAGDASVSVIDVQNGLEISPRLPAGTSPTGVAVATNGRALFVSNAGSNSVSMFDLTVTPPTSRTIAVGARPTGIAVSADGNYAYVANADDDSISLLDAVNGLLIRTITQGIGSSPYAVAVDARDNSALVSHLSSSFVSIVSPPAPLSLTPYVNKVAVAPLGQCGVDIDPSTGNAFVLAHPTSRARLYRLGAADHLTHGATGEVGLAARALGTFVLPSDGIFANGFDGT